MKKENGKSSIAIIVLIPIIAIVLIASIHLAAITGIIDITTEFIKGLGSNVQQLGWKNGLKESLGMQRDAVAGMSIYCIDDANVEQLKIQLEAMSIDTEKSGLTEVRLRKILLANIVSSSLQNTLSAVPVTQEDILNNINKKDPKNYKFKTIDEFTNYWDSNGKVKKSKGDSIWPLEGTTNYSLYYDSDVFFYFKDEDQIMGGEADQWYLGAMGATTIETESGDEIVALQEFQPAEFELLKINYENNPTEENRQKLKSGYKLIGTDTIELYTITTETQTYDYLMKWGEQEEQKEERKPIDDVAKKSEYINTQQLSLTQDVDTTTYAIPIEMLMNFLDMTGSGEFVEEFIDYALNRIKVTVTAYSTQSTSYTYNRTDYKVDSDFVLEIYDMKPGADAGEANFPFFKDLIFNRIHEGNQIEKVTDIENYKNLDLGGDEASELQSYIKTAYDPSVGFYLDSINVEITQSIEDKTEDWELMPYSVSTWYGTTVYEKPTVKNEYYLPTGQTTDADEFNNFGKNSSDYTVEKSRVDSQGPIEIKYIWDNYYNQLTAEEKIEAPNKLIKKIQGEHSEDIYDFRLNPIWDDATGLYTFDDCTTRGLAKIAMQDEGAENSDAGSSDYIYTKYTKKDVVDYEGVTKTQTEILDKSNVKKVASGVETALNNFLELLKNDTGKIPTYVGSEGGFKKEGKVVLYGDIYEGHIYAGDLLLDNGAEMLFQLLEASESTQALVNIFKYLAFLYTGRDYGVTLEDLNSIFELNVITSIYGTTAEEKLWYTLKGIGYSDVAAAAVMGNIYGESGFKSNNLEGKYETQFGKTDESYTNEVNSGTYNREQFINDKAGYGLAQWTYYTRKQGLYDYTKSKGVGIDDVDAQIEYLVTEIKGSGPASGYATAQMNHTHDGYSKSDWENATDIETATTAFCAIYENPSIPRHENRITAAKKYLQTYQGKEIPTTGNYNGTFIEIAKQCHDYIRVNNYYYSSDSHKKAGGCNCGGTKCGTSTGSSIPKPAKGEGNYIDCSSYVTWVLYEYGYTEFAGWQKVCRDYINNKSTYESKYGWVYKSATQAQAGDIVVNSKHMEIYIGNGQFLGAGCTRAIRQDVSNAGVNYLKNFTYAITIPSK